MKRFSLIALALICATWVVTSAAWAAPDKVMPDGSHLVTFSVPDMECSMCSRSVQVEIKRLPGVKEIKFDELNRTVSVCFDPSQLDAKKIQQAIKKAGFNSRLVEPVG